jgi:hypothetical protein
LKIEEIPILKKISGLNKISGNTDYQFSSKGFTLAVLYVLVIVPEIIDAGLNIKKGIRDHKESTVVVNALEISSWGLTFLAVLWYHRQLRGTVEEETAEKYLFSFGVLSVALSIASSALD